MLYIYIYSLSLYILTILSLTIRTPFIPMPISETRYIQGDDRRDLDRMERTRGAWESISGLRLDLESISGAGFDWDSRAPASEYVAGPDLLGWGRSV